MPPNTFGSNPFSSEDRVKPMKQSTGGGNPFASYTRGSVDLKSPEGLYDLASQVGLKDEADKMIQRSGGEQMKFGSGGFIMDVMDVLNAGSYGVVGMVKGKGFLEGIKNRETLADDDALGQYGFGGKVAGFIGDILLDPLTYISPIKLVTKIPGVSKLAKEGTNKLLGELTTITVDGQKTFKREGGWTPLTFLSDKLIYGFAVDKTFLDGMQREAGRVESQLTTAEDVIRKINGISTSALDEAITRAPDGSMITKPIDELEIEMKRAGKDKQFEATREAYRLRDSIMDELVDLGVVSKEAKEAHWGTYLKQSYDEHLAAQAKKSIKGTKSGIGIDSKSRVEGLTPEMRDAMGQVKDGNFLFATTYIKQLDLLKRARLQKFTADGYAMTDDMIDEFLSKGGRREDLHRIEDAPKYRLGEVDIKKDLASVNKELKTVLKERKKALRDDKELTTTISKIERELDRLKGSIGDDVGEALSGLKQILRENPSIKPGPLKKAPTSQGQLAVAKPLKQWLNAGSKTDRLAREAVTTADLWKEYRLTPGGIALERAFQDPRLMYQWGGPIDFMDAVRYPDKSIVYKDATNRIEDLTDAQSLARIKRSEANARKFGELEQTKKILSETNLQMVQEAVDRLEQQYADLLWSKSGILESLETNKMGQLAGKWVSKEVWNALKGSFEPTKEVGENLVLAFKHVKVVWNPASHVRNAFSASIQNWWKMGMGPWRPDLYWDAHKEFKSNGKFLQEMKDMGFSERSGYMSELMNNYLTNQELMEKTLKHQLGQGTKVKKTLKHIDRMFMNSYGHTDNVAKVAAYKYGLSKGLSKEDAYKQAMAATFNYSEITPFVHQMRRAIWGVPFITFAIKATPLVAETIAKTPGRVSVFGKARNALFQAAGVEAEQEAEAMPDYMRDDQFVMRLPWKDDQGRSMYFDLSYIIPFGAIADGSFLKDPLSANPITQMVRELSTNTTFGGKAIFKESDDREKVIADIALHVSKLYLPPPVTDFLSEGYNSDGERAKSKVGWERWAGINTQDLGAGERNYYQQAFKQIGMGAVPYELNSRESSLHYKQRENLTRLLQDNGVLKTFNAPYLPQDSELRPENQGFGSQPIYDRDVRPIGR